MNRRIIALLLCALAFALVLLPGLAEGPAVDDLAEVLHPRLVESVNAYALQMEGSMDVSFRVITRDFLGGKNIRAYADEILAAQDDPRLLLLVMVIGEEGYEVVIGETARNLISPEKAESLLNAHFRGPYLVDRDYSRAVAAFLLETGSYLQSRTGAYLAEDRELQAFAGRTAAAVPPTPAAQPAEEEPDGEVTSWLDSVLEDAQRSRDNAVQYEEDVQDAARGGFKGLTLFQIALIGFVLYKIFGKKRDGRKNGCGPLGWILGTWGVNRIFRSRK